MARNKKVRIVVTGGGTGGHITPLLAVVDALHELSPDAEITYIGERGGKFIDLVKENKAVKRVKLVAAGKYRRYYGVKAHKVQLSEHLKNIRDLFLIVIGFVQSFFILMRSRPDVIFSKGGFVALPVGVAGALLRIPIVTHDSDAVPGLTNRVLSKWAVACAVGMPAEFYTYPNHKLHYTGNPIKSDYYTLGEGDKSRVRKQYQYEEKTPIILVTGGSLGSEEINQAMIHIMPQLAKEAYVIHHAGKKHADDVSATYDKQLDENQRQKVTVEPFIYDMPERRLIADIVVSRASAAALAELQALGKASIIIPSPILTDGHQLKNAESIEARGAAVVLQENVIHDNPTVLLGAIQNLLHNPVKMKELGTAMHELARPQAAKAIADVILEVSGK